MKNVGIMAGLVAAVLIAGLIFSPFLMGKSQANQAFAQGTGKQKHITLVASEKEVQVAPDNPLHPGGIKYNAMVWNGTIPGPVVSIDQGDNLTVTLINKGKLVHSMDFHSGYGTNKANSGPVKPGETKTWYLQGEIPGFFFYHCSADALNGIWEHIANGMYGGMVVHPTTEEKAKEFYVNYGEIYGNNIPAILSGIKQNATASFDIGKFLNSANDLELTNGMAFKYVPAIGSVAKIPLNANASIFKVKPGELTRWYIVNAGPNHFLAFHFIGSMLTVRDGSAGPGLGNRYGLIDKNDDTWTIPPGSGSVIEATFPQAGLYVGVSHSLADVVKGGAFAVLAVDNATDTDHPPGTMVPPKGSPSVSGPAEMQNNTAMMAAGNQSQPSVNVTVTK
jgi:nitrite reductase (NO-forming)